MTQWIAGHGVHEDSNNNGAANLPVAAAAVAGAAVVRASHAKAHRNAALGVRAAADSGRESTVDHQKLNGRVNPPLAGAATVRFAFEPQGKTGLLVIDLRPSTLDSFLNLPDSET